MTHIFVVDFKKKHVVDSYNSQQRAREEAERKANIKTCGLCGEEYDKRKTILLEGFVNVGYGDKPIKFCECCITAMHDIVEDRRNEG